MSSSLSKWRSGCVPASFLFLSFWAIREEKGLSTELAIAKKLEWHVDRSARLVLHTHTHTHTSLTVFLKGERPGCVSSLSHSHRGPAHESVAGTRD